MTTRKSMIHVMSNINLPYEVLGAPEPSPQKPTSHALTRKQFRSWCPLSSVRAQGLKPQAYTWKDPGAADGRCLPDICRETIKDLTSDAYIDATTGLPGAAGGQTKGGNDDAVPEIPRFIYDVVRTKSMPQTGNENSSKALDRAVATKSGIAFLTSPNYFSRAQRPSNDLMRPCGNTFASW